MIKGKKEHIHVMLLTTQPQTHGAKTDKLIVEIDKSTIRAGDLNTPLSVIDRTRKKIS